MGLDVTDKDMLARRSLGEQNLALNTYLAQLGGSQGVAEDTAEWAIRVIDELRESVKAWSGPGVFMIRSQTMPVLYWLAGGHLVELGTFLREAEVIGGKPNHQKLERPELDMLVAYLRWVLVELDQDMKKGPYAS